MDGRGVTLRKHATGGTTSKHSMKEMGGKCDCDGQGACGGLCDCNNCEGKCASGCGNCATRCPWGNIAMFPLAQKKESCL